MPHPNPSSLARNKRLLTLLLTFLSLIALLSLLFSPSTTDRTPGYPLAHSDAAPIHEVDVSTEILKGGVISSKIGNETLKAELGRAAWKVLHTTMAKFPDKPTSDEQTALTSYLHLFARLYPCGECAAHFRQILTKFPPQVSTRSTAAAWACHVHNEVNKSLKKELFDCANIGDFYDCGCADEVEEHFQGKKGKGEKGGKAVGGGEVELRVERNGETRGG